jgi:regulatory protein
MHEITALKIHPTRRSRVEVFLDGRRWRAVPSAAAASLSVGMNLDDGGLRQLEDRSAEAEALERVGRLLAGRPRSEVELRRRLERAGYPPHVIGPVLDRLRASGDVDDAAFVRAWVENRMAFRPRGAAMLRSELRRRGIAAGLIDSALAEVDEGEAAWQAARRAARRWERFDVAARREKVYQFLLRRGFDHDIIRQTLRRLQEAGVGESEELP